MTKSSKAKKSRAPVTEGQSATTTVEATPEPSLSESVVAPKSQINVAERRALWQALGPAEKRMIGMTEDQFLAAENITGFGPRSTFTKIGQ